MIGFAIGILYEGRSFNMQLFLLVLVCMVSARSAAMAFNRLVDAYYDAQNPRTAIREIPQGKISKKAAAVFTLLCCFVFIGATFFINRMCFFLSPVALLVILGYSYTKRFTALCHTILGIGLSLSPLGAYLAVTNAWHWLPVLFALVVLTWVSGFDIIYALQDQNFDTQHKLHSIPSKMGAQNALKFSIALHIICAVTILLIGILTKLNFVYFIGASIFIGLLIYQHRLVKPNDLSKVNLAFFTLNGIGSIVFASFTILSFYIYNL
jgi:4-hydroxybenzoate polyprenyltransferase